VKLLPTVIAAPSDFVPVPEDVSELNVISPEFTVAVPFPERITVEVPAVNTPPVPNVKSVPLVPLSVTFDEPAVNVHEDDEQLPPPTTKLPVESALLVFVLNVAVAVPLRCTVVTPVTFSAADMFTVKSAVPPDGRIVRLPAIVVVLPANAYVRPVATITGKNFTFPYVIAAGICVPESAALERNITVEAASKLYDENVGIPRTVVEVAELSHVVEEFAPAAPPRQSTPLAPSCRILFVEALVAYPSALSFKIPDCT
jgi:hypothetical protein